MLILKPGIIGLALIFWGWQANLFFMAFLLALIYEGCSFAKSKWRWSPTDTDVEKVIDATLFLTGLLAIILLVYEAKSTLLVSLLPFFL